jgi:histone H2A
MEDAAAPPPSIQKPKKAKPVNWSTKAGLKFPVSRVRAGIKQNGDVSSVARNAPVFLAAVLEYLAAEILELSSRVCTANGKKKIGPYFIQMAIKQDPELCELLRDVDIASAGVMPHIHPVLLAPKKKSKVASA